MLNQKDILSTIEMIDQQHLDIRTITMGISLLSCCDPDPKRACDKIYEKIDGWKRKILSITNKSVNKSSQVSSVEVMKEPFEKTATQKIRRFKYKDSAPTVEEEKKEN